MPSYKKLVRERIPEIIKTSGALPITRILDEKEYLEELIKKLKEEVAEFEEAHAIEELADIQEVILAIRDALAVGAKQLDDIRQKKAITNGAFNKRIFLEGVNE